ncbi:hypothetical protein JCM18899A_19490 [Nocardioides sp. AN3]
MSTSATLAKPHDRPPGAPGLRKAVRLGLAGAALAFAALVLLWMITVPVFLPTDENGHVAYGLDVLHGHLPVMGERMDRPFAAVGQHRLRIFVGNHPPLYYALTGPIEWLGLHTGHPRPFLLLTRLLGAVLSVVTIGLVARIAADVTAAARPQARAMAVIGAAGLTATLAPMVQSSGTINNDPLMVVLMTATLAVLAAAVRRGLSWASTVVLAVLTTLGMLTRVSFLPIGLLTVGAVVALTLWPRQELGRPAARTILVALLRAALVTAAMVAGSGWFYALNQQRYGSISGGLEGGGARRALTPGAGHGLLHFLLSPGAYWAQALQLGGAKGNAPGLAHPAMLSVVIGGLVVASGVVAFVLATIAAAVSRRGQRADRLLDRAGWWMLGALLLTTVAAFAEVGQHANGHGWPNIRYMLPGLLGWSVGVSLLLVRVGRRLGACLLFALMTLGAVASVSMTVQVTIVHDKPNHVWSGLIGSGWWDALSTRIGELGLPAPQAVLAAVLALVIVGLTMVGAALLAVARASATVE